jgi:hypothetical protein
MYTVPSGPITGDEVTVVVPTCVFHLSAADEPLSWKARSRPSANPR